MFCLLFSYKQSGSLSLQTYDSQFLLGLINDLITCLLGANFVVVGAVGVVAEAVEFC